MGGLVVRSYLSGKQVQEGVFNPPADTKIRKIVFLGTPHFGSPATSLLTGLGQSGNRQTNEIQLGSAFLFDLATWNQGTDDLRGADTVAVLGNVSNGLLLMRSRFGDGVTTLTSGSLGFAAVDRTRIVPYCHTDIARPLCTTGVYLADIQSATHDSARIILSFLNDTPEWTTIGQAAGQNEFLSKQAGLYLRFHDANDQPQTPSSVRANGDALSLQSQIAYTDTVLTEQPVQLAVTLPTGATNASITLPPGATRALTFKPGPSISGIFPSFAAVYPRSVAPGSLISVYGSGLGTAGEPEVTVAGQKMPLSFAGSTQINTLVPANASGLVKLQVRNLAGQHTVNLLVEPVVPAVYPIGVNAVTGSSDHRPSADPSRRIPRALCHWAGRDDASRWIELGECGA